MSHLTITGLLLRALPTLATLGVSISTTAMTVGVGMFGVCEADKIAPLVPPSVAVPLSAFTKAIMALLFALGASLFMRRKTVV